MKQCGVVIIGMECVLFAYPYRSVVVGRLGTICRMQGAFTDRCNVMRQIHTPTNMMPYSLAANENAYCLDPLIAAIEDYGL